MLSAFCSGFFTGPSLLSAAQQQAKPDRSSDAKRIKQNVPNFGAAAGGVGLNDQLVRTGHGSPASEREQKRAASQKPAIQKKQTAQKKILREMRKLADKVIGQSRKESLQIL